MRKKLYTVFTFLLFINFTTLAQTCINAASATLSYVSNSGGNCTYNAVFSVNSTLNSGKLVTFTLPAGSTPSTLCFTGPNALVQVACSGGSYTNFGTTGTLTSSSVSVTIPCSAGTISVTATNNTQNPNNCSTVATATVTGANPVKLSYFKGYSENNQVHLQWQTEAETNSSYFMVQRSADAKEFGDLEMIKSVGESTQKLNYEYIDKNPSKGINYYRLRQVDNDGSFSYSRIIDIKQGGASDLIAFPNPSLGNLTLKGLDEVVSYEPH